MASFLLCSYKSLSPVDCFQVVVAVVVDDVSVIVVVVVVVVIAIVVVVNVTFVVFNGDYCFK